MSRRTDPRKEAEICSTYEQTASCKKAAKICGVSKLCVLSVLRRNGVKLKRGWAGRFEIGPEALAGIRARYEAGESVKDLAASVGTSWSNIHAVLVADGVVVRSRSQVNRKRPLRETLFDVVDEDGAYWVGFLMADGYVNRDTQGNPTGIGLTLAVRDEGHIAKFQEFLGTTYEVRYSTNENNSRRVALSVHSVSIAAALERFGVTPNKTHTAKVRHLEMNRDFWRGVIDGDGCIHMTKTGGVTLSLVGSLDLISQFRDFVQVHAPLAAARPYLVVRSGVYTFSCHTLSATKVIDVLYRDARTSLDRKKALADAIIDDPDRFKDGRGRNSHKYKHLSLDVLNEDYARLGSWKAVCAKYDVPLHHLAMHRMKLRRAANVPATTASPGRAGQAPLQGSLPLVD